MISNVNDAELIATVTTTTAATGRILVRDFEAEARLAQLQASLPPEMWTKVCKRVDEYQALMKDARIQRISLFPDKPPRPRAEVTHESVARDMLDYDVHFDAVRKWQEEDNALEQTAGIPPTVNFSLAYQLHLDASPPVAVVEGFFHRKELIEIAGASKTRKSWCAIQLALCVASGEPFLGMETKRGRVLYLNYELEEYWMNFRIAQVANGLGFIREVRHEASHMSEGGASLHMEGSENLDVKHLRGSLANFEAVRQRIISEVQEAKEEGRPYTLIILDPLYCAFDEDMEENRASDMIRLMRSLLNLSSRGPAVAFIHHFAKGNSADKDSKDRGSGSGGIARAVDGIVTLNRHTEDEGFVVESDLRNLPSIDKLCMRWTGDKFETAEDLDPNQLRDKQNAGSGLTWRKVAACATIDEGEFHIDNLVARVQADYPSLSAKTIKGYITDAKKHGVFEEGETKGHLRKLCDTDSSGCDYTVGGKGGKKGKGRLTALAADGPEYADSLPACGAGVDELADSRSADAPKGKSKGNAKQRKARA